MRVSLAEAADHLDELARLAQGGEEVVLTENDRAVVRLIGLGRQDDTPIDPEARLAIIQQIRLAMRGKPASAGTSAARSQDFLYDEDGLPG